MSWYTARQTERNGYRRLRFWRDSFWFWRSGRYVEWPEPELRASITTFLNRSYTGVNMAAESNVLNQVKAAAILSGRIDVPHWLDEIPGSEWPVGELLITNDKIVHLPSLFSGNGNRAVDVTPALFATSGLDFQFSWDECPRPDRWLGFLDELWPDDDEAKQALQLWFGYCLTADTSQQKLLAVFGPKRSGKSTIARVLSKLVGEDNTASPTLSNFGTNFGLWPLLGKPLAIIADARFSRRVDSAAIVERILRITGEDRVDVDRKYQPALTVRLPTRLVIISNELPRLQDASGALVSRMIVLSLTKSWFGAEDTKLTEQLYAELPGILRWACAGWWNLRQIGRLIQPKSGATLIGDLEYLSSPVGVFVDEMCVVDANCRCCRRSLYVAYRSWCQERGRDHVEDDAGFGRNLRSVIPLLQSTQPRIDGQRVRCYVGIQLK